MKLKQFTEDIEGKKTIGKNKKQSTFGFLF